MFLFVDRSIERPPNIVAQSTRNRLGRRFLVKMNALHDGALQTGLVTPTELLEGYQMLRNLHQQRIRTNIWYATALVVFILVATPMFYQTINALLGVRCFLPNNYLVLEATRPITDCQLCRNIDSPRILKNITQANFAPFAYSAQPIIVKNGITHWPVLKTLNFTSLKTLYERVPGAISNMNNCQFLNFHSNLKSVRDVFQMSPKRANLLGDSQPWYVGWSNCHPVVLEELRKLYPRPHFLPTDAEIPKFDYIFLGYEQGVFMHLEYVPRLMWQAQLRGNKNWLLSPTPECIHVCRPFSFYVEPGDTVLIDTRIWYHSFSIPNGQFSLTLQSEYG